MTGPENAPEGEKTADQAAEKAEADNMQPESNGADKNLSDDSTSESKSKDSESEKTDPVSEKTDPVSEKTDPVSEKKDPESEMIDSYIDSKDISSDKNSEKEKKDSEKPKSIVVNSEEKSAIETVEEVPTKPLTESQKLKASSLTLTQVHVSHLLSDVLQDDVPEQPVGKGIRFPMILDCLLAIGLLVAVGGFTIGLFQMYLIHSASQSISEQRYKAAITILNSAPMPQIFARPGSDTEELMSKARYLDAIDKLEAGTDTAEAMKELGQIKVGSRYFALAQEAINENTEPATMMLQGGTETTETNPQEPQQSLLEKTLKEEPKK